MNNLLSTQPIILASSSIYRQQLLDNIGLTFNSFSPKFIETEIPFETPKDMALRLAIGKAKSICNEYYNSFIIGSDQVAFCNGVKLGKPLSIQNAEKMLTQLSGNTIEFYTALCLLNTTNNKQHTHVDYTEVKMRSLSSQQIHHYVANEPEAIYCAGAAKSEGLGAALIKSISTTDPNALIGLPIFTLIDFLEIEGFKVI